MKSGSLKCTALVTSIAILVAGCENMTPGENAAVFGSMAGVAAGSIASAAGLSTGQSIAVGAATGAIVAATVYVIAKHQATERQRRIAEERARAAYAHRVSQQRAAAKAGKKTAKKSRYIAVDTVKDERTSPKAKKSVMIYDTQSQQIVGNNVYDVEKAPAVGQTARFETYSAEYVGSGS
jgi:hypothetical protein